MRCLTLADALRERGRNSTFICRAHEGHLLGLIEQRGHTAIALPAAGKTFPASSVPSHAAWLGTNWESDAEQTRHALQGKTVDWLVVDHYALDYRWEQVLRSSCRQLMVIDDLADRPHDCDLLLDQNLGRTAKDYDSLLALHTRTLIGPRYALLRPEFAKWRPHSLTRRESNEFKTLIVTMGGVDKGNATGEVLKALRSCSLPEALQITVVMGATATWLDKVQKQVQDMPWPTRMLVGVSDMAQLMADSDLAIGAAGATSWERCCLGLPTILIALAENQLEVARALKSFGAAKLMNLCQDVVTQLKELLVPFIEDPEQLHRMSECAASIVDGAGVNAVMQELDV